jgi:hypothetical protein
VAKNHVELATLLTIETLEKNGPFGVACAAGSLDGFPVAVAWTKRERASIVGIVVRFRRASLSTPTDSVRSSIESNAKILAAMGQKKLSSKERKGLAVLPDGIAFTWYYSIRAPRPERVADVVRALIETAAGVAKPVGTVCEKCEQQSGELYSIDGSLFCVCAGCRERVGEEDRIKIAAYEALPSRPLASLLAGAAVAAVMALAWGLVAYGINRIFLYGAFLIGGAIAWAVNRASGKVTVFGRAVTVVLTITAVMAGDFLFIVLTAANDLKRPVDAELLARVARAFLGIEFSEPSGWISLLFALIGAVYILYKNRPPVSKRKMVPVRPVFTQAYEPIK